MNKVHAWAVFEGWKANAYCNTLPADMFGEEGMALYGFIKYNTPIRGMLAYKNKPASDALWDGHQKSAFEMILKFGLLKRPISQDARERDKDSRETRETAMDYRKSRIEYSLYKEFESASNLDLRRHRIKR